MTTLQNRNIHLNGQRTSLRLEPSMWEALEEICRRERRTVSDICALIESQRGASSRTAAVRVFILRYFRAAATESGHSAAGHGQPRDFLRSDAMLAAHCRPFARPRARRGVGLSS